MNRPLDIVVEHLDLSQALLAQRAVEQPMGACDAAHVLLAEMQVGVERGIPSASALGSTWLRQWGRCSPW